VHSSSSGARSPIDQDSESSGNQGPVVHSTQDSRSGQCRVVSSLPYAPHVCISRKQIIHLPAAPPRSRSAPPPSFSRCRVLLFLLDTRAMASGGWGWMAEVAVEELAKLEASHPGQSHSRVQNATRTKSSNTFSKTWQVHGFELR
jgi:hypothetical protein